MIKAMWTLTSVSVMVIAVAVAIMFCIASGSILKEDVAIRVEMEDRVQEKLLYARKHCKRVGTIEDPKNKTAVKRQLFRCPAYQMLVI